MNEKIGELIEELHEFWREGDWSRDKGYDFCFHVIERCEEVFGPTRSRRVLLTVDESDLECIVGFLDAHGPGVVVFEVEGAFTQMCGFLVRDGDRFMLRPFSKTIWAAHLLIEKAGEGAALTHGTGHHPRERTGDVGAITSARWSEFGPWLDKWLPKEH